MDVRFVFCFFFHLHQHNPHHGCGLCSRTVICPFGSGNRTDLHKGMRRTPAVLLDPNSLKHPCFLTTTFSSPPPTTSSLLSHHPLCPPVSFFFFLPCQGQLSVRNHLCCGLGLNDQRANTTRGWLVHYNNHNKQRCCRRAGIEVKGLGEQETEDG